MTDFRKQHVVTENCTADCYGCKLLSVTIGGVDIDGNRKFQRTMAKDNEAYRRLRHEKVDGVPLQPKSVKGAAELESRAASRFEVESGINLGGNAKAGKQYDEIQGLIKAGEKI